MDDLKKVIQNNILKLMSESGISMRQLSADINCSESYVQKILSGDFTPKLERLLDISDYFNVPIWALFLSEENTPDKLSQIEAYLLEFDEETLEATLNIIKRIRPKADKSRT